MSRRRSRLQRPRRPVAPMERGPLVRVAGVGLVRMPEHFHARAHARYGPDAEAVQRAMDDGLIYYCPDCQHFHFSEDG